MGWAAHVSYRHLFALEPSLQAALESARGRWLQQDSRGMLAALFIYSHRVRTRPQLYKLCILKWSSVLCWCCQLEPGFGLEKRVNGRYRSPFI
eukprot:4907680-Amphidinium_carterae.1